MTSPADIGTAAEAERLIDNLNTIMDRLVETVEAETAHMRKGRVRDALALEAQKQELASRYAAESGRVRVAQAMIAKSGGIGIAAHVYQSLLAHQEGRS